MTFKNFLALEKKTSSGIFLDNLTGIRAAAVLWVLVFHTWGIVGGKLILTIPILDFDIGVTRLVRMGEWGVDIFFVLSGFLLTLPFLSKNSTKFSLRDALVFYYRRALRILPAYYFTLLALIYLLLFGLGKLPTPLEMLQHVLFINTWFDTPPLRGAFWSLPVEALFYLALPLFIWSALRFNSFYAVFLPLIALTIVFRFIIINTEEIQAKGTYLFSFFGRMDQFSIGALCAYICLQKPLTARKGSILLIVGIIGLMLFASFIGRRGDMFESRDYFYYFYQTLTGLLAAAIIYGAASPSRFAHYLLGNKIMVLIGTISYSIYLWHTIILDIYSKVNPAPITPASHKIEILIFYTWPPIFLLSFFSYLFIERHFLKIRHDPADQPTTLISRHPLLFLGLSAVILIALTALAGFAFQQSN